MFRQSSGRNQRSKGIKLKHVLQIALLLAVCFWLIYQVKHSHDKKESDASDTETEISFNTRRADEVMKFGRKDLLPQSRETVKTTEKPDEEETEEETGGEDEGRKHEEEDREEDKTTEDEDEGRGGGDNEIDEHEEEKSDTEGDQEEDLVHNAKDGEEGDENENEKDGEDEEGHSQTNKLLEDPDHVGAAQNTHEAREENYKGDDASSAVTHDTETTENENGTIINSKANADIKEDVDNTKEVNKSVETAKEKVEDGQTAQNEDKENSDKNAEGDSLKHENEINDSKDVKRDESGTSSNGTTNKMGSEDTGSKRSVNSEITVELNNQTIPSNNSVDVIKDSSLQIGADLTSDLDQAQNTSEKSTTSVEDASYEEEGTDANSESSRTEKEIGTESETINEREEKIDENSETENLDEIQRDAIESYDSSFLQEEKDVGTDLDSLPDVRIDGSNSEDAGTERLYRI